MKRSSVVLAVAGLVFVSLLCLQAALGGRVMPSYVAAWLFCLALPAGALPLVMAGELGFPKHPLVAVLRSLLVLMPLVAFAAIPIVAAVPQLYVWAGVGGGGWFSPVWFGLRLALCFVAWCILSLLMMRPPRRPRRVLCMVGLMLHAVVVTLVASDVVMSLDQHMAAAGFGLLLMAAQCGIALSTALLLAPGMPAGGLLLALLAAWGFCHFIQYLVVWSANKPDEIGWYIERQGLGQVAVWLGVAAFAPAALVAWRRSPSAILLAASAGMVLLAHAAESLWLVTPSLRGGFVLTMADLSALAGLVMLCASLILWRRPAIAERAP